MSKARKKDTKIRHTPYARKTSTQDDIDHEVMQTVGLGDVESLISNDPRFSSVKSVVGMSGEYMDDSDQDMEQEKSTKKGKNTGKKNSNVIDINEGAVKDMMEDEGDESVPEGNHANGDILLEIELNSTKNVVTLS